MVNYKLMLWMCFLGSLLATAAMGCLVAYSFAGGPADAPVATPSDRSYLRERAPLVGRLNALLVSEAGPAVDVTVPPVAGLPGVDVTVDPAGVDVTVNPSCPVGGCPDVAEGGYPESYPHGGLQEGHEDYNAYADEPDDGGRKLFKGRFKGSGFLSKLRERGGGGFLSKIREREGGPLRKLFGRLFRCGR